jgi:hypothetical protein
VATILSSTHSHNLSSVYQIYDQTMNSFMRFSLRRLRERHPMGYAVNFVNTKPLSQLSFLR